MPKKRATKRKSTKESSGKIDVQQELLRKRHLFLYGVIDDNTAYTLAQQLIVLDSKNSDAITLWINSPGGSVTAGLAIIDVVTSLRSPVITAINGLAASMAGVISVCGSKRVMTRNSLWMSHDVLSYIGHEYVTKVIDRIEFAKWAQSKVFEILRTRTKLTEKDLNKARVGELWLDASECLKKGVVDIVI